MQNPRHINPKKLFHSKWTAVNPQHKEKHFLVIKVIAPTLPAEQIEQIELQAVYSARSFLMPWNALNDASLWLQGWQ